MTHPFTRDFWRLGHLRTTWEYKTLAFILRAIVATIVAIYIVFALMGLWEWLKTAYVHHQPVDRAAVLMQEAIETGDFARLQNWLRRRPGAEAEQHARLIEENISAVPFAFLSWPVQAAVAADDTDRAVFWQMMTRYRLRYDLVRCGNPVLIEKANDLMQNLAPFQPGAAALAEIERDPARLAAVLQEVLDYDAQHPARNDPRLTCDTFKDLTPVQATPMPRAEWNDARHLLRLVTERSLEQMREATPPPAESGTTP